MRKQITLTICPRCEEINPQQRRASRQWPDGWHPHRDDHGQPCGGLAEQGTYALIAEWRGPAEEQKSERGPASTAPGGDDGR